MMTKKVHKVLQVREFPQYQPCPRTVFPPLFHAVDFLPYSLLADTINVVFRPINWHMFTFRNLQRSLVFASVHEMINSGSTSREPKVRTYLSSSKSSVLSGKKSRGSSTARTASAARYKNESPSRSKTSHRCAHVLRSRWLRKRGISQSGRYAAGDIWCCLKLKYTNNVSKRVIWKMTKLTFWHGICQHSIENPAKFSIWQGMKAEFYL